MRLLMHACCAPCSIFCVDTLRNEGIEPTLYWYNPNIHPYMEYKARKDTLIKYSEIMKLNLVIDDEYGLDKFCENTINDLNSRCINYCYPIRLRKTFEYAKENGYDTVTTTLLYSIYQKHDYIKKLCKDLSEEYEIEFLYRDFRLGFWEGHDKAKELELYMQKYCGCIFSEQQIFLTHTNEKPKLPDGFEFLPVTRATVIRKEKEDKEKYTDTYLPLMPNEELLKQYLRDGDVFVLSYKEDTACVALVNRIDEETIEIKSIVTMDKYKGQDFESKMIKYLSDNYKSKYKKMIIGTTENNIPFYVKQGFDKYEKTIKNYFMDNYDEEIWDGDLQCIDMYYYSKDLKNK